jgi:phosphoglycerate dehydrogenase-like enzyme
MRVIATRRRAAHGPIRHVDELFAPDRLPEFLAQCDVLVIAAPLTSETNAMIGGPQLEQLPKGAIVVNVGRAKILDTNALIGALRLGHLGGAALDVFPQEPLPSDHELWKLRNVILTPHTSGFRQGHWEEVIALFADNLERWLRGEPLRFRVEPELGY